MYVIIDQPHKDIPVYTVENQRDETVKIVHHNLFLPLPTILDWMRPHDPDILVKHVYAENKFVEEVNSDNEDDNGTDDDDSNGDSDLSSDEPICICTRSQKRKQESSKNNNTNDIENTVEVTTDGLEAQVDGS